MVTHRRWKRRAARLMMLGAASALMLSTAGAARAQGRLPIQWMRAGGNQGPLFLSAGGGLAVAVGGRVGNLEALNTSTRALLATLTGDLDPHMVSFSPDGKTVAVAGVQTSGGYSVSVQLWNLVTGKLLSTLSTAASNGVVGMQFSPDGTKLIIGGLSTTFAGTAEVWNASTGKLLYTLNTAAVTGLYSITVSPDGKYVAIGGYNAGVSTFQGVAELWSLSTGKLAVTLPTRAGSGANSVSFSADSSKLVVGGAFTSTSTGANAGIAEVWSVSSNASSKPLLSITPSEMATVQSAVITPNGATLIDSGNDFNSVGRIETWSVKTGKINHSAASAGISPGLTLSGDGKTVADLGTTGAFPQVPVLECWDVASMKLLFHPAFTADDAVSSITFSKDSKDLFVGGQTGLSGSSNPVSAISEYAVASGKVTPIPLGPAVVSSVAVTPDSKSIAVAGSPGVLGLNSVATGLSGMAFPTTAQYATSTAVSPNGKTLVSGGFTAKQAAVLEMWTIATGKIKYTVSPKADGITSVAFSPDGTLIADGGGYGSAGVLELRAASTGVLTAGLATGISDGVSAVAFTPDGSTVVAGGSANYVGVIELWNTMSHTLSGMLPSGLTGITSIAVSADGTTLVAGGYGGGSMTVTGGFEVWDLVHQKLLQSVNTNSFSVNSVAFSPDNATLFVGTDAQIQAYSPKNYGLVNYFDQETESVSKFAFAQGSKLIVYGRYDGALIEATNPYYVLSVSSVASNPGALTSSAKAAGSVMLNGPAVAGTSVNLKSSSSAVTVPASVPISTGGYAASFNIAAATVTQETIATITASYNGSKQTVNVRVDPNIAFAVTLSPTSIAAGASATATVTLKTAAPAGGLTFDLSADSPAVMFTTPTLSIPAGKSTGTFTVSAGPVTTKTTVHVSAVLGSTKQVGTLTVTP